MIFHVILMEKEPENHAAQSFQALIAAVYKFAIIINHAGSVSTIHAIRWTGCG